MDLNNSARLCRLCLCNSNRFINVLEENGDLGFIVAKTIEDLLQFKVRKLGNYPWLTCSTCLEKLIEFRLFKSRCIDSNVTFEKRFCQFYSRQFGPKDNTLVAPHEPETNNEETQLERKKGVDMSNRCPETVKEKTSDQSASGSTWHNNEDESVNLILCQTETDDNLNHVRGISDIKQEDVDIEEGGIVGIKEEPQGAEENELMNPSEVPHEPETNSNGTRLERKEGVDISNRCPEMVIVKTSDQSASGSTWHNNEDECVNLILCKTETDDNLNHVRGISDVKQEDVDIEEDDTSIQLENITDKTSVADSLKNALPSEGSMSEATKSFGVESALHHEVLNSRFNGPNESDTSGCEIVTASENTPFGSNGQSPNELKGGLFSEGKCFCCAYCDAVFTSESNLRDHTVEHEEGRLGQHSGEVRPHGSMNSSVEEREYSDVLCGSAPINLSMKMRDRSNKSNTTGDPVPMPVQPMDMSLECKNCSRVFSYLQSFRNHEISCINTYTCSRCKKSFSSHQYLSLHMKTSESDMMFSCPKCPKSFNFKCELMAHRAVHTKIFVCKNCDCVFSRYYHLREHIMVHCKVKPLTCRDCKKTFIGSQMLRKHRLEVHSGR